MPVPAEEYMEFISFDRAGNSSGAGGTGGGFVAYEIPLPVSENEQIAMAIHMIDIDICPVTDLENESVEGHYYRIAMLSTWQPLVAEDVGRGGRYDAGVLWHNEWMKNTEETLLSVTTYPLQFRPSVIYYNPPILIARRSLWLGIISNAYTDGDVRGKIGYTLRKVSRDKFIDAMLPYQP